MKYMVQDQDNSGNWTEDVVGNDTAANTFSSRKAARAALRAVAAMFEDQGKTIRDYRIVERQEARP